MEETIDRNNNGEKGTVNAASNPFKIVVKGKESWCLSSRDGSNSGQ